MSVIGLTGFAQSGKDTAAGFLAEFGYKRLAFADILRQSLYNLNPIVKAFPGWEESDLGWNTYAVISGYARVQELVDKYGWDHVKVEYPEVRELLQRLGTEVGRELYGESFWVDRVMSQIESDRAVKPRGHETAWSNFVITDVRFPNEYEAVRNAGGQVFRIERPGVGAVNNHASEQVLPYDIMVHNTGDLDHFRRAVLAAASLSVD